MRKFLVTVEDDTEPVGTIRWQTFPFLRSHETIAKDDELEELFWLLHDYLGKDLYG